jgi:hypothetical protein
VKINQPVHVKQRRRPLFGVAVAGAALAMGAVASTGSGTATAARDQAPPAAVAQLASVVSTETAPINLAAQTSPATVNYAAPYAQIAYVKVTNALLRAQPNTSSTKLDVSQPGRAVDVYCWHDYTDVSHYVWFKSHPHGSKFTGWMRADLLRRTGPLPPKC